MRLSGRPSGSVGRNTELWLIRRQNADSPKVYSESGADKSGKRWPDVSSLSHS